MKFKGQGEINICGFEYKKKIADSRTGGGGSEHPKKNPVTAPVTVSITKDWEVLETLADPGFH